MFRILEICYLLLDVIIDQTENLELGAFNKMYQIQSTCVMCEKLKHE